MMNQLQNIKQQLGNIDIQFDQLMNLAQTQNMTSSNIYSITIQILNIGINMLNLGTQVSNMKNGTFNYALQIENIGMQIQNIGNQIKNMNNINNMNNNIIMPNLIPMNMMMVNDKDWMAGFQMGIDECNDIIKTNEINITFKTTQGIHINMMFKKGTTIDEVIKKFFYRVNRPKLIQTKQISFLYNGSPLRLGDMRKIEDVFNINSNPVIVCIDNNNLLD